MTDTFVDPDAAAPAEGSPAPAFNEPQGFADPDTPSTAGAVAATGAAAGITGYGASRLWNQAFPGMNTDVNVSRNVIRNLEDAVKKNYSGKTLRDVFTEYENAVTESKKPMSFADWASNSGYHVLNGTIADAVANSGDSGPIEEKLKERSLNTKDRVKADLAKELGVTPQSLGEGYDKFIEERAKNAKPLYDAAFANKGPLVDSRLNEVFKKYPVSMGQSLNDARGIAAGVGRDLDTAIARDADHKLFWKNPVSPADIEDPLKAGEYASKAQKYFQPSVEDLHRMRESLWKRYELAKRSTNPVTNGLASTHLDAWKEFTQFMDDAAPDEYRFARQKYKADSDMLRAFETGSDLFRQDPHELNKMLARMSPEERTAMAQGFYGKTRELFDKKSNPRAIEALQGFLDNEESGPALKAMFRNDTSLNRFIEGLKAEAKMEDSFRRYTELVPSAAKSQGAHAVASGISAATGHLPSAIYHGVLARSAPSENLSRNMTDKVFELPKINPNSVTVPQFMKGEMPTRGFWNRTGEFFSRMPKSRWATIPAAVGALGAAAMAASHHSWGAPHGASPLAQQAEEPLNMPTP